METKLNITDPQISVERAVKKIAIFDAFKCVRDFKEYTDEAVAVAEAKEWLKQHTDLEPMMVYPRITRMRMS